MKQYHPKSRGRCIRTPLRYSKQTILLACEAGGSGVG